MMSAVVSVLYERRAVARHAKIGMHEIKEALVGNIREQWMRVTFAYLVPTDLRDEYCIAKASHPSRQQAQSFSRAKLFGFFEEHLHAYTNPQQRNSFRYTFANQLGEAVRRQAVHASGKGADTR